MEELDVLQRELEGRLAKAYETEGENSIREYETNGKQIQGMKVV